jgi:hypothetical protein
VTSNAELEDLHCRQHHKGMYPNIFYILLLDEYHIRRRNGCKGHLYD